MPVEAPTARRQASLQSVEIMVGLWCDQTDPARQTGADAVMAVERLAKVIKQLTAKQAAFAERVDACRAHPKQAGSPEDWLARQNGTSRGDAKKAIDTARRLKGCPATADAFSNGDLSLGEADLISGAASVDPAAEAELVAKAKKSHDLADTKERAAKVRAAARHGEDPEARRRRLRARRRWSEFDDDEMRAVAARFLPEEWARVAPVVDAFADAIFERARKAGITDPADAYRADAVLAALAAAGELFGIDLGPNSKRPATIAAGPAGDAAPTTEATAAAGPTAAAEPATPTTESTRSAGPSAATEPAPPTDDFADATGTEATGSAPTDLGSTAVTTTAAGPAESTGTAAPAGESSDTTESTATAAFDAESRDTTDQPESELDALLKVRPGRVRWNVSVLIDGIALKRGYATASETCEIVGVGPVDVAWVSRILPESIVDVLVHDLVDIRAHATMTRHRKKAVDKALRARDRRCVVPGCRRKGRLQADHRHDFAKGGPTSGANLELLCEVHHYEKTHCNARIERTDTEWHWYPPPPKPGEPEPPPGSIPWRAPIGEHLTAFDLDDLPDPPDDDPGDPTDRTDDRPDPTSGPGPDDTLPFG